MNTNLLEQLTNHFGSYYLSALNDPKNTKNGISLSKVILLSNADKEFLEELQDSMKRYFTEKNESIEVVLENEKSTNQNYKIDVGYFLNKPIPRY